MNTETESPAAAVETITLWYKEGASDKVYQANLIKEGDNWTVTVAYGRRGSTLATGSKTAAPVEYAEAKRIYDKLVQGKMAKGYTPGPDGTPYAHTAKEERATGILPQLLNPIEQRESLDLMRDSEHCMQEKFDGKRILLRRHGVGITGTNRRGLLVGLPVPVAEKAYGLTGDFIIDGESVGGIFHAFDILEWNGESYRSETYENRLRILGNLLKNAETGPLRVVYTTYRADEKERLLSYLLGAQREGVVFKRLDAPYTSGRPASGGPQLKHKFYSTLSALVGKINAERSVEIHLNGANGWQSAGNVAIPANRPIPPLGAIVEIRYLYAFRQSGRLFQPNYLGVRDDLNRDDCPRGQLKFKSEDEEEA